MNDREKIAVRLSLPRQGMYNAMLDVERPAGGLPINALPGWESIPLHSKLPMLKCPDNHVIFTKNKIGRTFESFQRDFDSVCQKHKLEYNPLHDPHLRRFYSNEKLLKRLRDNGEITENNDVICTLKEFNEHRIPLHEVYLSLIRIARAKMYEEKMNDQLIKHAEFIAEGERQQREKNSKTGSYADAVRRKTELLRKRGLRMQAIHLRALQKDKHIKAEKEKERRFWDRRRDQNNFKIQQCLDEALDIQRKKRIALKKNLQFKSERLKANITFTKENAKKIAQEKARLSWEAHMEERFMNHEYTKKVIKETEQYRKQWVENHIKKYRQKWKKLEMSLETQARQSAYAQARKLSQRKSSQNLDRKNIDQLRHLTNDDLNDVLHTAIDMENLTAQNHKDDYIYNAAKFVLEETLAKFNKDLSNDACAESMLSGRIAELLIEVKQYVIKRATQILNNMGTFSGSFSKEQGSGQMSTAGQNMEKLVSFGHFSSMIGSGSYDVMADPLKETSERFPTPKVSLTSVVLELSDSDVESPKSLHHLSREERIFIEHLFIKFKRELIVGIGRHVLAAIECHRNNKILKVRKELQEITKEFLVKAMTRSILSYAVNSCNFYSNSILCQYALASDIISYLQSNILKPRRDPRFIAEPHSRCTCPVPPPFAAYCKRDCR